MRKSMWKRTTAALTAAMLGAFAMPVMAAEESTEGTREVTDAAGNVVEVPENISKIAVTPLPWSSVIYAIDGTSERMVSINPGAISAYTGNFLEKMDPEYGQIDSTAIGKDFSINMEEMVEMRMVSINPGAISAYTGNFLEKMDPEYGQIDSTAIGKDFSINMEEMVEMGVEAVVIWDYQEDEAKQLKELGIAPVMVKNETVEELQESFRAIGELLGKEDRAQQFIDLYEDTYKKIKSYQDKVESAEKPKVLYLRNSELKLQGNDNFIKEALELAGADNVAAENSDITMEEILEINPDIILLSWFDEFTPEDLYNNTIDGQDWSNVKAVQDKRVYKTPIGIYNPDIILLSWFDEFTPEDLYNNTIDGQDWSNVKAVQDKRVYKTPIGIYRWDAPGVETPLMMEWLASLIQPEVFSDIDIRKEVADYFKTYFEYELTDEDVSQIMSDDFNKNSAK